MSCLKKRRSLNVIPSWSDRLDGGTDIGFVVIKELERRGSKWMKKRERKGCVVVWVNIIGRCYTNGLVAGTRRTEGVPCRPRLAVWAVGASVWSGPVAQASSLVSPSFGRSFGSRCLAIPRQFLLLVGGVDKAILRHSTLEGREF